MENNEQKEKENNEQKKPKQSSQENKEIRVLIKKLSDSVTVYQTEVSNLQNQIREIKQKEQEAQEELEKLQGQLDEQVQEKKDDEDEIVGLLKNLLAEADKVGEAIKETKNLFEVPPKS